jgi:hypothetical protein
MGTRYLIPTIAAVALTSTTAFAQSSRQPETPVTLTGCIQREADYRKTHDIGKGGVANTGIGDGNEYVLINASRGASSAAGIDCSFQGKAEAYELTGSRERDLRPYVGKVVQIAGTLKEAKTKTLATGEQGPTGGFDPLKRDLRLFEVEVRSFQEPAAATASRSPAPARAPRNAPATPAQRPAEPAAPAAAEPAREEPPQQIARAETELPQTASPLALSALIGILSLTGALGIRRLRQ